MKTINYLEEDDVHTRICSLKKSYRISFSSFQKAIKSNSIMRKQVEDIVDLGLYEYAFRQNTELIRSACEKAETETIELMMQFVSGVGNYLALSKIIHRNRVIKTLATKDRKEHSELINRITHLKVASK